MKQNSWHYKLATIGNNNESIYSGQLSICQYARRVFYGFLMFIGMLAIFGMLGFGMIAGLYQLVGALFGFAELGEAAYVFIGVIVVIVGLFLYVAGDEVSEKYSEKLLAPENTSFTSKVYKSYKSNICFQVEFEE